MELDGGQEYSYKIGQLIRLSSSCSNSHVALWEMPTWSWIQDPLRHLENGVLGIVLEDSEKTCKILVDYSVVWVDKSDIEYV